MLLLNMFSFVICIAAGLAGLYYVVDKKAEGGCGDRWNLDDIEEFHVAIADKVLDSSCQWVLDEKDKHKDNFYGDINYVSGKPWPVLTSNPKWVRFRILNTGIVRPYLLHIVNQAGDKVQHVCKVREQSVILLLLNECSYQPLRRC